MTESMSDAEMADWLDSFERQNWTWFSPETRATFGRISNQLRRLLPAKADEDAARELLDKLAFIDCGMDDAGRPITARDSFWKPQDLRDAITAALAAQRRASDERIARLEALLWAAWRELHTIQARDGVPYTHGGFKAGVSEHYWAALTGMIGDALGEDAKPWPSDKIRPHLRVVQDYQDALETVAGERDEEGDR